MRNQRQIMILRILVIPALLFFLILVSSALTPEDSPSVAATVVKKEIKRSSDSKSYMLTLSGNGVIKERQAIPENIYHRLLVGDQIYLIQSEYVGSWIYLSAEREGKEIVPKTNIKSGSMIIFAVLFLFVSLLAYLPQRFLENKGRLKFVIFLFGCISIGFSGEYIIKYMLG